MKHHAGPPPMAEDKRPAAAPRPPQPAWRTAGRLLRFVAPLARRMALAALLGFATIGSSIGLMATSGYLIARAALQPSIADLQVAIVGVRFFGIARGAFRYLERYVSHDVTFRLLARLRVWFYEAVEPLAPAVSIRFRSGDLLSRIVADVGTLENFYLRALAPPIVALLSIGLVIGLLVGFAPWLAAVAALFLILAATAVPIVTQSLGRQPGLRLVQVRADLHNVLVDGIQGLADLLAFGQEQHHLHRVRVLGKELEALQGRMATIEGLHTALTGFIMNLAVWTLLILAIPLVRGGTLDGVLLTPLLLALMAGFEAVLPLPQAAQYLGNSLEAARRLFQIADAEPAIVDPVLPAPPPRAYSLHIEGLRFSYGQEDAPALDGIDLSLAPGRYVAVVGPSGAGKSTLAHLLLRFWEYQDGHILLAGRELREYSQQDVQRLIAVVSQRTHLFNATVRDNLLLARPDASKADMVQAAQQAQIHDFVQSLPQGYDTWIGEQGLRLSAGQRQRLAVARAILKGAPILLFDEPTANLDALTERSLVETLCGLAVGRTTLIITHRLVGLECADEVVVLRAGRIVERGRHHELLQMGGLYRRMWDLQTQVLEMPTTEGHNLEETYA